MHRRAEKGTFPSNPCPKTTLSHKEPFVSNVIEFKRPPKPKEPKKVPPLLKKMMVIAAIVAALVLAWAYFQFIAQ